MGTVTQKVEPKRTAGRTTAAALCRRTGPPVIFASSETCDKGDGRLETRRHYQSVDLAWFADLEEWEGLRSVCMVESIRETAGKITVEWRYYLSSLSLDIETFAKAVRGHWGVENSCHWVLDVVMREDDNRTRRGHAPENLATLRRMAMNIISREKTKKRGIKGKQRNASWDHSCLLRLVDFQMRRPCQKILKFISEILNVHDS